MMQRINELLFNILLQPGLVGKVEKELKTLAHETGDFELYWAVNSQIVEAYDRAEDLGLLSNVFPEECERELEVF